MDERMGGEANGGQPPIDLDEKPSASLRLNPRSASEALQPVRVPAPPVRARRRRNPAFLLVNFVLTFAVVALLGVGGAIVLAKIQFERPGPLEQPRSVVIARGTTLGEVADLLQRHGIISNKWVFRAGVRLSKMDSGLKAGEYLVNAHASMREIMEVMVSGKAIPYAITIPEGLTSQQVADRINADPVLTGGAVAAPAEGSVLPETYKFTRGDTREDLLDRMRRERDRVLADVWSRRVDGLPISTPEELVTLASIVEKETGIADERSRVARVFINRLQAGMRLQSDPTVIYGIFGGRGKPADRELTRADLDTPTPYNTYLVNRLPPGPIANPGRASLEAVANPSRTGDLYFVADGTGGHVFAQSYEEHLRNVARWRQIEAKRRQQSDPAATTAAAAAAAVAGAAPPVLPVPAAAAAYVDPTQGIGTPGKANALAKDPAPASGSAAPKPKKQAR